MTIKEPVESVLKGKYRFAFTCEVYFKNGKSFCCVEGRSFPPIKTEKQMASLHKVVARAPEITDALYSPYASQLSWYAGVVDFGNDPNGEVTINDFATMEI